MNLSQEMLFILGLSLSFLITYLSIPTLVKVAKAKNLYDVPGLRKSHKNSTPTLGGVAIFAGTLISASIFTNSANLHDFKYIIAAITIIFFIGIKDDILVIAPNKKLIGEFFAAIILVILADIRITSLHGFLGIYEIPYITSILLTLFVIIVILNGINLIDGIDGLASGVGIIAASTFGIWFYLIGQYQYVIISVALIGSLLAFIRFNIYQGSYKIFMGDTGSLIIGLILAIFAIKFNQLNTATIANEYASFSTPAVSIGILIVPLFDTLRVFFIRIKEKRSPFSADRNHVHHRLLKLGYSHLGATARILIVNILFIAFVFLFDKWGIYKLMFSILVLASGFSYIPSIILKSRKARIKSQKVIAKYPFEISLPPREKLFQEKTAKTKESVSA